MSCAITVREHARLTVDEIHDASLDRARISSSAFDWLCRLSAGFSAAGARLVELEDRRWLRLDNFVGVIETPCGTRIEILPKHIDDGQSTVVARTLLRRMISATLEVRGRETGWAYVERFDGSVSEWLIERFLSAAHDVVKRGVRFEYARVEGEEPFLRGQLNLQRQMRQPSGREHLFQIRQDLFLADRAENRLLMLGLDRVAQITRAPANWRVANELRHLLSDVPRSKDVAGDFGRWGRDSLMAHYRELRPWCEMILQRHLPLALAGAWRGISMLFPMEKLFERYVAAWLRGALHARAVLTPQAARHHLCTHDDSGMFQLRPDLLVSLDGTQWVLDTKWKLLQGDSSAHYGLSQADLYQMFAYGQKYLGGRGDLFLIYPWTARVPWPLKPFKFGGDLRLHVVPFDLEKPGIVWNHLQDLPLAASSS